MKGQRSVLIDDWRTADSAESTINLPDQFFDSLFHSLIVCDADSGRNNQHDQGNLAAPFRVRLEHGFKTLQTVEDALRVILSVDRKDNFGIPEALFQFFAFFFNFLKLRGIVKFFEIYAHREGPNFYAAPPYGQLPHLVSVAEYALNGSQKIFSVIMRVEPDQVRAKQPL